MFLLDASIYDDANIPEDTKALNEKIITLAEASPSMWEFSAPAIRQARNEGKSIFPLEAKDPNAEDFYIPTDNGDLKLRAIRPDNKEPKGVFMHIHGGGCIQNLILIFWR